MMVNRCPSKGLTLAELLFLLFVLVLIISIAIPLLRQSRSRAFGLNCSSHLMGIGSAMLVYANDYYDQFPRAGGRNAQWAAQTPDWAARDLRTAFGLNADGTGGKATVSASLYLLVKYSEVLPTSFICGTVDRRTWEKGTEEFRPSLYGKSSKKTELIDVWDFGPAPQLHCNYAYHMPYGTYALAMSDAPDLAMAADRNPWIDSPSAKAKDFLAFKPDIAPFDGTATQGNHGNTFRHQGDGQNVLFLDTHVEFAKRAYCGIDDDNIYTVSSSQSGMGDPLGTPPTLGSQPANRKDSLLVNDPPVPGNLPLRKR